MVAGLVIKLTEGTFIQNTVSFDYQFFFNLLLPPIILGAGYELHQVRRYKHRSFSRAQLTIGSGQLFSQPRYHLDLCICGHLHLGRRLGIVPLVVDSNPS